MSMKNIFALILAAGKGTRMHSQLPKVLQPLGGKAIVCHLLDMLINNGVNRIGLIHGYKGEKIQAHLSSKYPNIDWIEQKEQLGTGHAVLQAMPLFENNSAPVLILLGDAPLLRWKTIQALLTEAEQRGAALLTTVQENPTGYGRVLRNEHGAVIRIVEEKDASDEQWAIKEVNTGVMAVSQEWLQTFLPKITNNNKQQEYYLTDLIGLLTEAGHNVQAVIVDDSTEVVGINDKEQLAQAEAIYRLRQAKALLQSGVTLIDPTRLDIYGEVIAGQDVLIEPNVFFKGKVVIGDRVVIESGCVLKDCTIGDDVVIHTNSIIEDSTVESLSVVGPFARLRPKAHLCQGAKVGNFVEIKGATVGKGSKVNHLSYIGDASLGEGVNIGAGTITCNYDGVNKFQTVIGDRVFVGSNTALVAPVSLGDGSTIGAGSVITKNVEAEALALTRAKLKTKLNWPRPVKKPRD